MRKCGKFVLLLLLVIMTIAVLAACNGKEGAQTGVDGNTPGGGTPGKEEIVTKPYGLWFDLPNGDTFSVGEFDLATDVVGYVLMQTGSASPIVSTETRFTLTSDMIAEEDRDKLNGPYDGKINVTYTYKDTTLTGFFNITIKAPQAALVDVTVKLGDGASMRGGGATETETPGVWTIKLTEGATYTYSRFVTRFFVSAPEGKAIDYYTYGGGTVFDAGNPLTVTAGMTLEAVYTSTVVDVVYDLNAPVDAWAEGSAPTAPDTESVSVNGYLAGAGNVQRYASDKYTFIGWFTEKYELDGAYDPTAKWNTNKKFKDQSDVRDTLYLYGMWLTKSATVSFDLARGTLVSSLEGIDGLTSAEDMQALASASYTASYSDEGRIDSLSVNGIKYGTTLADYKLSIALTEGAAEVTVALKDIAKLLTKGGAYVCGGLWTDAAHNNDALEHVMNSDRLTVYVGWDMVSDDIDEDYYTATFRFVLKPDNTWSIGRIDDSAEILYIPGEYRGLPVTEIASSAFSGMSGITRVDFSAANNLVKIGASAFYACTSLVDITGTEGLTSLTTVGAEAFNGTAYMNNAASGNTDVTFGGVLVRYRGQYGTDNVDMSAAPYRYIASGAFADFGSVLQTVKLPDGLKGIENDAFRNSSVTSVTSDGTEIDHIGADAFDGSVFILSAVDDIIIGNVFYLAANPAQGSDGTVTVPANVTVIAEQAFAGATRISNVVFENEEGIRAIGRRAFRGTPYANNAKDGFVIVNGILASYQGGESTVVVPDEVEYVAPYAFGSGVRNVVFRATSELKGLSDYAFADATSLSRVAIYKDDLSLLTLELAPNAFTNGTGTSLASSGMQLYLDSELRDQIAEKGGTLLYLQSVGKIIDSSYASESPVILDPDIFVLDYVAAQDGTFGVEELAATWGGTVVYGEDSQPVSVTVEDGISVTRDGMTVGEDFSIPVSYIMESLAGVTFTDKNQMARGVAQFVYDGNSFSTTYVVHAAIDEATFKPDDTYYSFDSSGRLEFYTTQESMDTSGVLKYTYKQLLIDGKTEQGAAGVTGEVPLSSENVTVTGYTAIVGEYDVASGKALTVTYDYYGKVYEKKFAFVVRTPRVIALRQTSTAVLAVGSAPSGYYGDITFEAIYDDGLVVEETLEAATITHVNGSLASDLYTAEPGVYTANIEYRVIGSGSVAQTGTIVYAVELVPIYDLYTFEYTPYPDGPKDGVTGTATIVSASGNRAMYVLPTTTVNPEDNGTYTVTAIGDNVFKGKTALTTVYIPPTVTSIGAGAFSGCTSLTDLLGFDYDTDAAEHPAIDASDVRISTEHREATVGVEITGISDYAISESVITIPYAVAYNDVMGLENLRPEVLALYTSDAVITVTYTLRFAPADGAVDGIKAKLADYAGTVRIPAVSGVVVEEFAELYAALVGVVNVELYEAETLGMAALVGRIEMSEPAMAELEYTSRTGTVIVVGAAQANGDIMYIPKTVTAQFNREGGLVTDGVNVDSEGTYTVTALDKDVLAAARDITAVYLPDTVISLAGDSLDDVFDSTGATAFSARVYMYSDVSSLLRPHTAGISNEPFPENVTYIGAEAFMDCRQLDVDFSTAVNVTEIGARAFMNCYALSEFVLGRGAMLTDLGSQAFMQSGVTLVDISAATKLDLGYDSVFDSCASLTTLVLPDELTQIGVRAFYGCEALQDVSFDGDGKNLTYIGAAAFYSCAFDSKAITDHAADGYVAADDAFENCKPLA